MKKIVILSFIFIGIFSYCFTSKSNNINAMGLEDDSVYYNVGQLHIEKEIYSIGDSIDLFIQTNVYENEIMNIHYNGLGFDLENDFEIIDNKIYFSIIHISDAISPSFEIIIEVNDETIILNLYGYVEDDILSINENSYDDAYQSYLFYLNQNNTIKHEEIKSMSTPTISITLNEELLNNSQFDLNTTDDPDTKIFGKLQWQDDYSIIHPLRFQKVQLCDREPIGHRVLMETLTNSNGEYEFEFKNATESNQLENGGYDIFVKVLAAGDDIEVCNSNGSNYYLNLDSDNFYYEDCSIGEHEIETKTFYMVGTDYQFGQACQIAQAAIFSSKYYEEMKQSDVENVKIEYAYDDDNDTCFYKSSNKTIYIYYVSSEDSQTNLNSYASWDVIMHEYGHHISNVENITDGPGGNHYIKHPMSSHYYQHFVDDNRECSLNCIINESLLWPFEEDDCKYEGLALAWGEGLATYFMIAAQKYYSTYLSNITFANDEKYTASNLSVDIESYMGKFQDDETSVQAILYDFLDNNTNEEFDNVSFEHQTMYNYIINSDANTFFEFYEYFITNFTSDKSIFSKIGILLNHHHFSTTKAISSAELTQMCPTFTWDWEEPIHSTQTVYFKNRRYALRFYDLNKNLIYHTNSAYDLSYTLTEYEWSIVLNRDSNFYVSVIIYEDSTPTTYYESEWAFFTKPIVYDLYNNTPKTKSFIGDDCYWFKFTATETDLYTIQTTGNVDTYGNIFSSFVAGKSTNGSLYSDDDAGEGYNFLININLNAGQSIYIRVNTYGWNKVGDFTIKISSSTHIHDYSDSYTSSNARVHYAYCDCGTYITESHNFVPYQNGYRCSDCYYYTTGPVIVNPIQNDNEDILYFEEKKEEDV